MALYDDSPLPPGHNSIRLLRLMPCGKESMEMTEIQCELFTHSLQDRGKGTHLYEALSYVWGDPKGSQPIRVNGKEFHVTANLHAALMRLRDHSLQRILWVDAICINQGSDEEKGDRNKPAGNP